MLPCPCSASRANAPSYTCRVSPRVGGCARRRAGRARADWHRSVRVLEAAGAVAGAALPLAAIVPPPRSVAEMPGPVHLPRQPLTLVHISVGAL
jgi:hypothetical protein